MDIVSAFNPPRILIFGSEVVWCRAITQEDFALLVAWVDDVLPNKGDRVMPPKLGSEEARQALDSPMGWTVQAWAAMRHFGVSYERAASLILAATEIEKARFLTVFYRKRPTFKSTGEGLDISEAWWGPQVAKLSERGLSVNQIGAMTLDQVDMLFGDGIEREMPQDLPGRELSIDEVQAIWEASRAKVESNGDPV